MILIPAYLNDERIQRAKVENDKREKELLAFANKTLDESGKEVKSIAPRVLRGEVFHPNLNKDGTWKGR